jgi:hypothetical protein
VQRDIDLMRDILLRIEADEMMDGTREFMFESPSDLGLPNQSSDEVAYHIALLIESGLIKGAISSGFRLHVISALTWDGHEFLDNIRDPNVWANTKQRLATLNTASVSIIRELAESEMKKQLGLASRSSVAR